MGKDECNPVSVSRRIEAPSLSSLSFWPTQTATPSSMARCQQ